MSNVRFSPKVRSESNKQTPLGKPAGFSKNQTADDNDLRKQNSQTGVEQQDARMDPNDKNQRTAGIYNQMSADDANELFFDGIDKREKRGIFRDKYDRYFFIGIAALTTAFASAKALGLLGFLVVKYKKLNEEKIKIEKLNEENNIEKLNV